MKIRANAKINLFLDVLGKRRDGYHNIKTVFQEISLSDDIFIEEIKGDADTIKVFCDDPSIPTDEKNLVHKATSLIKKLFGIKKGVEIKIRKRIPVGAGLGGGSSDAAAVLSGLNKLWDLKLSKKHLAKIGKKIGADVPFFIYGGRCLGEGIGDIITPLKFKKNQWYVLVMPPFGIQTKSVYSRLSSASLKAKRSGKLAESQKIDTVCPQFNVLESVVIPQYPEIKKIKNELVKNGAVFSLMSGSGSCVFGLVKNKDDGERIKNCMRKGGYAVWLVKGVETD